MALSKRLFSIFQMVEKGSVVADIGCDHGLLAIALVQEEVCAKVYACDLRTGPLSRAKAAIQAAGLEKQITTLQRNGIDDLPSEVDTIVIAGMGFDTIKSILEAHEAELSTYRRFIIQSNTHVEELRRWISAHNYTILMEDIVEEEHFYQILSFQCKKSRALSEDEILFGTVLEEHPLFLKYWHHQRKKQELILSRMPKEHMKYQEAELHLRRILTKIETVEKKKNL